MKQERLNDLMIHKEHTDELDLKQVANDFVSNSPSKKKKAYLMRIAIEGPDLSAVNFDEVLDIFKQKNRQIRL